MRWLKAMALMVIALLAAGETRGQEATPQYRTLLNAGIFAFGGVGFAGRIRRPRSHSERSWPKIMLSRRSKNCSSRRSPRDGSTRFTACTSKTEKPSGII